MHGAAAKALKRMIVTDGIALRRRGVRRGLRCGPSPDLNQAASMSKC